jgi:hypothetical protein
MPPLGTPFMHSILHVHGTAPVSQRLVGGGGPTTRSKVARAEHKSPYNSTVGNPFLIIPCWGHHSPHHIRGAIGGPTRAPFPYSLSSPLRRPRVAPLQPIPHHPMLGLYGATELPRNIYLYLYTYILHSFIAFTWGHDCRTPGRPERSPSSGGSMY